MKSEGRIFTRDLGRKKTPKNITFVDDHPYKIPTNFSSNWPTDYGDKQLIRLYITQTMQMTTDTK